MPGDHINTSTEISLKVITEDTCRSIFNLDVADHQKGFVAPNVRSIAQAYFSKEAWFRGIYLGEEPVGFVMLYIDSEEPEYFLWRLMIDKNHQKKGYGYQAMKQVIEYVRNLPNADELLTSYVPGDGDPSLFYYKLGFQETGEWEDDEKVLRLDLAK